MFKNPPVLEAEMVRIPGLFRRWELPQVLTNHLAFRIEDAGAHEDGTPLLAIYTAGDGHPESDIGNVSVGNFLRESKRSCVDACLSRSLRFLLHRTHAQRCVERSPA